MPRPAAQIDRADRHPVIAAGKGRRVYEAAGDDAADDWVFRARDAQLPPSDLGWGWLFLGGRGTGKSHSMSAAVHMAVRAGPARERATFQMRRWQGFVAKPFRVSGQ